LPFRTQVWYLEIERWRPELLARLPTAALTEVTTLVATGGDYYGGFAYGTVFPKISLFFQRLEKLEHLHLPPPCSRDLQAWDKVFAGFGAARKAALKSLSLEIFAFQPRAGTSQNLPFLEPPAGTFQGLTSLQKLELRCERSPHIRSHLPLHRLLEALKDGEFPCLSSLTLHQFFFDRQDAIDWLVQAMPQLDYLDLRRSLLYTPWIEQLRAAAANQPGLTLRIDQR
jgi:hypothetical protein